MNVLLYCLPGFLLVFLIRLYPFEILSILGGFEDTSSFDPRGVYCAVIAAIILWPLLMLVILLASVIDITKPPGT